MTHPADPTAAEIQIEQFAKDFEIPMESFKYNQKRLVITFHCVDASPSEVNRWTWEVPAFVIKKHYALIASEVIRGQKAVCQVILNTCKYDNREMYLSTAAVESLHKDITNNDDSHKALTALRRATGDIS